MNAFSDETVVLEKLCGDEGPCSELPASPTSVMQHHAAPAKAPWTAPARQTERHPSYDSPMTDFAFELAMREGRAPPLRGDTVCLDGPPDFALPSSLCCGAPRSRVATLARWLITLAPVALSLSAGASSRASSADLASGTMLPDFAPSDALASLLATRDAVLVFLALNRVLVGSLALLCYGAGRSFSAILILLDTERPHVLDDDECCYKYQ